MVLVFVDGVCAVYLSHYDVQRLQIKRIGYRSSFNSRASLQVDVEIQEMCSNHAKGKPVTITRGGNRVRLRAVMPNGGATLVTYDTRVTSQVCGRVVYVHSDNTEVKQHANTYCGSNMPPTS